MGFIQRFKKSKPPSTDLAPVSPAAASELCAGTAEENLHTIQEYQQVAIAGHKVLVTLRYGKDSEQRWDVTVQPPSPGDVTPKAHRFFSEGVPMLISAALENNFNSKYKKDYGLPSATHFFLANESKFNPEKNHAFYRAVLNEAARIAERFPTLAAAEEYTDKHLQFGGMGRRS